MVVVALQGAEKLELEYMFNFGWISVPSPNVLKMFISKLTAVTPSKTMQPFPLELKTTIFLFVFVVVVVFFFFFFFDR